MKPTKTAHVHSPRLVHPEQAADFQMEIVNFDLPELSDEELVLNAEELFLELDRRED